MLDFSHYSYFSHYSDFSCAIGVVDGFAGVGFPSADICDSVHPPEGAFSDSFMLKIDRSIARSRSSGRRDTRVLTIHLELLHRRCQPAFSHAYTWRKHCVDIGEELLVAIFVFPQLDLEREISAWDAHFDRLEAWKDDPCKVRPNLLPSLTIVANDGTIFRRISKNYSALCVEGD